MATRFAKTVIVFQKLNLNVTQTLIVMAARFAKTVIVFQKIYLNATKIQIAR
jgi:hypothetical protein